MSRLKEYAEKRDVQEVPAKPGKKACGRRRLFVLDRHDALRSGLHHDFRYHDGNVLKSWCLPKLWPDHEGVTRLAIQTEDHPLGWLKFEGEIKCLPAGILVATARGSIPIESVKPECDQVIGIGSRGLGCYPVKRLYRGTQAGWARLGLDESCGEGSALLCGLEHGVYVGGKGFVRAEQLSIGDAVLTCDTSDCELQRRVAPPAGCNHERGVIGSAEDEGNQVVDGQILCALAYAAAAIPPENDLPGLFPPQSPDRSVGAESSPPDCFGASADSHVEKTKGFGDCFSVDLQSARDSLNRQSVLVVQLQKGFSVAKLGGGGLPLLKSSSSPHGCEVLDYERSKFGSVVRQCAQAGGYGAVRELRTAGDITNAPPLVEESEDVFGRNLRGSAHANPPKVRYAKIKDLSREFVNRPCFDLLVEDAHNYFAGGVLVHNSRYGKGTVKIEEFGVVELTVNQRDRKVLKFEDGKLKGTWVLWHWEGRNWLLKAVVK